MADKPTKVGLIGANSQIGWAAATHLPVLACLRDFDLVAVCTTNEQSARRTAARYSVPHIFTDAASLANHPEVELVVVSVKSIDHKAAILSALEAGKHVFCEWPLGTSLAVSEELCRSAVKGSARHFVGLQGSAASAVEYARELVEQGYLGDLLSATMVGGSRHFGAETPMANRYALDRQNGANLLTIICGHALDMLCYLAGEIVSVSAIVANRRTRTRMTENGESVAMTSPDQVAVSATLACGGVASIHIHAGIVEPNRFSLDLHGMAGTLRLSSDSVAEILPLFLEGTQSPNGMLEPILIPPAFQTAPERLGSGPAVNVARLYQRIARDMREGTRLAPDFLHAVRRRRAIQAIQDASDTNVRQIVG